MRKFGIIGYPLAHSFSPAYFAEKFLKDGLTDCSYQAFPLATIDELSTLLYTNPEIEGLNVTIPYKKKVISLLHNCSAVVSTIGSCNCIHIIKGKLTGYNTDVVGFERSFTAGCPGNHTHALVLGTGGSAAAVSYVLAKRGIKVLYVSRKIVTNRNYTTYDSLTEKIVKRHTLIINTTPVGMFPFADQSPNIPYHYLTPGHLLFDLIYNPAETCFLRRGAAQGALTKNGLEMLQIQAEESWKIWNTETIAAK